MLMTSMAVELEYVGDKSKPTLDLPFAFEDSSELLLIQQATHTDLFSFLQMATLPMNFKFLSKFDSASRRFSFMLTA